MNFVTPGTKVQGKYFGVPYTGVVESARQHSLRHDASVVHVTLDKPITVLDLERDGIALTVDNRGFDIQGIPSTIEVAA